MFVSKTETSHREPNLANMVAKQSNPFIYDELLHVDASKRPRSIPYLRFDPVERIHGQPQHIINANKEQYLDFLPTLT